MLVLFLAGFLFTKVQISQHSFLYLLENINHGAKEHQVAAVGHSAVRISFVFCGLHIGMGSIFGFKTKAKSWIVVVSSSSFKASMSHSVGE